MPDFSGSPFKSAPQAAPVSEAAQPLTPCPAALLRTLYTFNKGRRPQRVVVPVSRSSDARIIRRLRRFKHAAMFRKVIIDVYCVYVNECLRK